jgi:formate-dependent phosphoribosylglycinamide formyltransferase (GAR transformylase)
VEALVQGKIPPALQKRIDDLARAHEEALAPVDALAAQAREEARGVLVTRVAKALPRPVKKALLSRLEERAPIGVVVEGRAVTAATFRDDIDLSACDELAAGRSDYRFGQADDEGRAIVSRLGALVRSR